MPSRLQALHHGWEPQRERQILSPIHSFISTCFLNTDSAGYGGVEEWSLSSSGHGNTEECHICLGEEGGFSQGTLNDSSGKVILCTELDWGETGEIAFKAERTVWAINKGRKVRMGIVAVDKCDGAWGVGKGKWWGKSGGVDGPHQGRSSL